jgi:hypothetical protein
MLSDTISRIRRNHALEHATIHMLTAKHRGFNAQGNAAHNGFYLNLYGDLPEEAVVAAVEEAYQRLKGGEHHLAVHPNCGTALLTTAAMATLAAQASFAWEQKKQGRPSIDLNVFLNGFPSAVLAVVIALIMSKPIGLALQANYTTDGDLGNLQLKRIERIRPSFITRLFQLLLTPGQTREATAYKITTG